MISRIAILLIASLILACSPAGRAPAKHGTILVDSGHTSGDVAQVANDTADVLDSGSLQGSDLATGDEVAADLTSDVDVDADGDGALEVKASQDTLIPPPLLTTVKAYLGGVDVSDSCAWSVGPSEVCVQVEGGARKTGDGECSIACTRPDGKSAKVLLVGKKQTVIYVVGGYGSLAMGTVARLRVSDKKWDTGVATLPEGRYLGALGVWNAKLFVIGGLTASKKKVSDMPDAFVPKKQDCPELIDHGGSAEGCKIIRVLDLTTGAWSNGGMLPVPLYHTAFGVLDQAVFLLGGVTDPPNPWPAYRYDMAKMQTQALNLPEPTEPKVGGVTPVIPWESGLLFLQNAAGSPWWLDATGSSFGPTDIPLPCEGSKSPPAIGGAVPGFEENLIVIRGYDPSTKGCLPGTTGATPLRWWKGKWSAMDPIDVYSNPIGVPGPDGFYLISMRNLDSPFPMDGPCWRLANPEGKWEELPAMPEDRLGFGAIATVQ